MFPWHMTRFGQLPLRPFATPPSRYPSPGPAYGVSTSQWFALRTGGVTGTVPYGGYPTYQAQLVPGRLMVVTVANLPLRDSIRANSARQNALLQQGDPVTVIGISQVGVMYVDWSAAASTNAMEGLEMGQFNASGLALVQERTRGRFGLVEASALSDPTSGFTLVPASQTPPFRIEREFP